MPRLDPACHYERLITWAPAFAGLTFDAGTSAPYADTAPTHSVMPAKAGTQMSQSEWCLVWIPHVATSG